MQMYSWINFIVLLFWACFFGFFNNITNFIILIFFSEIFWIILYTLTVYFGLKSDFLEFFNLAFFILALAGSEFVLGFMLVLFCKELNVSLFFYCEEIQKRQNMFKFLKIPQIQKKNWLF